MMVFDTVPLKLGFFLDADRTKSKIYEIPDFQSQSLKPSSMDRDLDGYFVMAGASLD